MAWQNKVIPVHLHFVHSCRVKPLPAFYSSIMHILMLDRNCSLFRPFIRLSVRSSVFPSVFVYHSLLLQNLIAMNLLIVMFLLIVMNLLILMASRPWPIVTTRRFLQKKSSIIGSSYGICCRGFLTCS